MVGLSRSTFYRYRDCVEVFDKERDKTFTLYLSLDDKPGVLAAALDVLRNAGANVLTINQNMPVSGVAPVCITLRDNSTSQEFFSPMEQLRALDGVIDAKLVQF